MRRSAVSLEQGIRKVVEAVGTLESIRRSGLDRLTERRDRRVEIG